MHRGDRGWRLRWGLLLAGDLLAAPLAYLIAFFLRVRIPFPFTTDYLPALRFAEVQHHWTAMIVVQGVVLYFLGLYETRASIDPRRVLASILTVPVIQTLVLIAVYFFEADLVFPRSIFVLSAIVDGTLLVAWRYACRDLMARHTRRRVLVVGTHPTAEEVVRTIEMQRWLGRDVVGIVAAERGAVDRVADVPVVGTRNEVLALCQRFSADEVILVSEPGWQDSVLMQMRAASAPSVRLFVVPSPYEVAIGRNEHLRLHDIPLIEVVHDPLVGGPQLAKRAFDMLLSALLLVVAVPVMTATALLIRITSAGPVLFRQTRVGKDGRPFTMLKLRTMQVDAERKTGPVLASENDPRITGLGRVLRATRLDEVPQLWNVVRGDMSFVGPRPERPEFVERFALEIEGYANRFQVRPGVTGYAQVNGEYHTSPETKLKYDLAYMYNRSLWLDLKILSATVRVMLTRRGV